MLTTRLGRLIPFLFLITAAMLVSLFDSTGAWATIQDPDTSYDDVVQEGKNLFRQHKYDDALKKFKRANEMREKKSAECYAWMSETYLALEAYKNVIESADKMIEFAGDDRDLLFKGYNNKGLALQASAERKDQKKLQAAEAVFRQAIGLGNAPPIIHYNLGVALMQLNRDEEGVAEIKQYLSSEPKGSYSEMGRKLVENPRRARENFAPDFSFTSQQGEYIALEDLKGKVVVLDFWGTWCPPCVESVPELRNLHKRYSKEPSFVLIGISSDSDEEEWREFTEKNKMVWPQYRDKDRKVQRAFGVRAFPTYIVIDHEGIVRYRSVGLSFMSSADLDGAIRKQVKIVAKSTEAR
jgi:peroxiredoxin